MEKHNDWKTCIPFMANRKLQGWWFKKRLAGHQSAVVHWFVELTFVQAAFFQKRLISDYSKVLISYSSTSSSP